MTPEDRKYTKTHEWVKLDGEVATVGITDHAQEALGDITFVELPQTGAKVENGKECGVIESVKAASDLYSPVSGDVVEVNSGLEGTPEIINASPYDNGWFFRINGIDHAQIEALMDAATYDAFLKEEEE